MWNRPLTPPHNPALATEGRTHYLTADGRSDSAASHTATGSS